MFKIQKCCSQESNPLLPSRSTSFTQTCYHISPMQMFHGIQTTNCFLSFPTCLIFKQLTKYLLMPMHILFRIYKFCFQTWDPYLANRAAQWSETCYFEHQRGGVGENLSYFTSTGRPVPPRTVIQRSIGLWAAEKRLWRWSTSCGAACHYTQVQLFDMNRNHNLRCI